MVVEVLKKAIKLWAKCLTKQQLLRSANLNFYIEHELTHKKEYWTISFFGDDSFENITENREDAYRLLLEIIMARTLVNIEQNIKKKDKTTVAYWEGYWPKMLAEHEALKKEVEELGENNNIWK